MDVREILTKSIEDLQGQPRIILPAVIGFLAIAATYAAAARPLIADARAALLAGTAVEQAASIALSPGNIIILLTATLIAYAISLVSSGVSFVMCVLAVRKKKASAKATLANSKATIPHYIGARLLIRLLAAAPAPLLGLALITITDPLALAIALLGALITMLVWTLYVELRFLLGAPEIFLENARAQQSLRRSYGLTGRALGTAATVGAVIIIIVILESILRGPVNEAWTTLILGTTPAQALLAATAVVTGAVILGAITTVQHSFLLRSHASFPKDS